MEAHERVLHELLKMGEMLLGCGAEINRVEGHDDAGSGARMARSGSTFS